MSLTSITVPGGILAENTQYKVRTRYHGANYGPSDWAEQIITTAENFHPGPGSLTYDDTTKTGYYGHTTAAELITGDALASQIGLTAGISQYSDAGWEKFFVGADADCNPDNIDKVLYIAKKTFRYNLVGIILTLLMQYMDLE